MLKSFIGRLVSGGVRLWLRIDGRKGRGTQEQERDADLNEALDEWIEFLDEVDGAGLRGRRAPPAEGEPGNLAASYSTAFVVLFSFQGPVFTNALFLPIL